MRKSIFLALFVLVCNFSFAQSYKVHALFVFSFTRYVIWPETYNEGDFEILVLGDSPILDELKGMAQAKKVGDRVIKITKITSAAQIKKCNMIFVPANKSVELTEVIAKVNNQPMLIITEEPGLGSKGSDINFITKDGKLVFELNQAAVEKQNLKVANELSRLAIMI